MMAITKYRRLERAASLTEYALLVGLIAVVAIPAVGLLGRGVSDHTEEAGAVLAGKRSSQSSGGTASESQTGPGGGGGGGGGGASATTTTTSTTTSTTTTAAPTTVAAPTTAAPTTAAPTTAPPTTVPSDPAANVSVTQSVSAFYWWNGTSTNGNGQWVATATFANGWIRHQYLDLQVVRTHADGRTTTETIQGFYVPAGGTAELAMWNNDAAVSGGTTTGVRSVSVTVTRIVTSDLDWKPYTTTGNGTTTKVAVPTP